MQCTGVLLVESMSWICVLMGGHIFVCTLRLGGELYIILLVWLCYVNSPTCLIM